MKNKILLIIIISLILISPLTSKLRKMKKHEFTELTDNTVTLRYFGMKNGKYDYIDLKNVFITNNERIPYDKELEFTNLDENNPDFEKLKFFFFKKKTKTDSYVLPLANVEEFQLYTGQRENTPANTLSLLITKEGEDIELIIIFKDHNNNRDYLYKRLSMVFFNLKHKYFENVRKVIDHMEERLLKKQMVSEWKPKPKNKLYIDFYTYPIEGRIYYINEPDPVKAFEELARKGEKGLLEYENKLFSETQWRERLIWKKNDLQRMMYLLENFNTKEEIGQKMKDMLYEIKNKRFMLIRDLKRKIQKEIYSDIDTLQYQEKFRDIINQLKSYSHYGE